MASGNGARKPGGLDDMRVVEIGDESGDFCGMLLAGEGADVIKVEPPDGSPSRRIGPFFEDRREKNRSLYFWTYNRGKRGVTADLQTAEGRERFLKLIATADVVIDAQGLGVMDALELGYDRLSALNPKLIYCSITPFGLTGPWRHFQTSDLVHQALGGSAYCIGYNPLEDGTWDTPPFMAQRWHSYHITAEHAAVAIAAAFLYQRASGEGQLIDVSVHDACAQSTESTVTRYIYTQKNQRRNLPQQFRCADGNFLAIVVSVLHMARFPKIVELLAPSGHAADLQTADFDDPVYRRSMKARERIGQAIRTWVTGKTVEEAFHALQSCSVICGPVWPPDALPNDSQCLARENYVEIEHPELGRSFTYPRQPSHRTATPWRSGPRAPLIGEHDDEIWGEVLGATGRCAVDTA